VRKVLVVKFFGIGSLVLATPFLRAVRKVFPNAEIHLLTLSSNREITALIPTIDRVHCVDLGANPLSALRAFVGGLIQTFKGRYEVLIDMEFYTRASAIVALSSWAPVRVGFHSQGVYRGNLPNRRVPFNAYWHVTQNFLSLLEPFGFDVQSADTRPALAVPQPLTDQAQAQIEGLGAFIVINVNAGELAYERRWSPQRFGELAARLSTTYDLTCVFIGAPGERDYVQGAVEGALALGARAVNSAGQLNLVSMAQICREGLLVITNDSGPLHIAAATNTPVVGFFGPETPVLYGPTGDNHLVFHHPLSCSPCINIEQGKHLKCWHDRPICQDRTTVEDAFKGICHTYGALLSAKT